MTNSSVPYRFLENFVNLSQYFKKNISVRTPKHISIEREIVSKLRLNHTSYNQETVEKPSSQLSKEQNKENQTGDKEGVSTDRIVAQICKLFVEVSHVYTYTWTHHACVCSILVTYRAAQSRTEEIESNYSQLKGKRLLSLLDTPIRAYRVTRAWNGTRTEERKIKRRTEQ